jgi:putative spermidine/putrescine transport system substrate-binding protein
MLILICCMILAFLTLHVKANAAEKVLVVAMYGGDFQKSLDQALLKDFEKKYNAKVLVESGVSSEQTAKIRAQKNNPKIDVAILDQGDEILLGKEGLLEKLTAKEIPNIGDLYDIARNPKGVSPGFTFDILGLVYNKGMVTTPPASWNEMWDPRYKNRINLFGIQIVIGYLTLNMSAILNGGDLYNLDPGFKALEKLKPNVYGIVSSTGEIWLLPFYNARTQLAIDQGAPIGFSVPKEGGFVQMNTISVVKNAKHADLAKKLVNMALSPGVQKKFAELMYYGPTNKKVELAPEVVNRTVYGQEAVSKLLSVDVDYVNKNRGAWSERFDKIFQ